MTQLTLAKPPHFDVITKLVADFHAEEGITQSDETRAAAILPLLEGSPHGAIYLAGPARAPVGYVALTFGWSLEFGGMDGFVDEIYIRPGVRGRGIGTEILAGLPAQLAGFGLKAVHLEVDRDKPDVRRLYEKMGFQARDRYMLMSRAL
ncbi:MAG: GNAT family N-acetyltransferase [Pseudomonadota bacterium]